MSTQTVLGREELPASKDCLVFSRLGIQQLDRVIVTAKILRDHTIVNHPLECPKCFQIVKCASGVSDAEMDTKLIAARNDIQTAREGKK